MSELPDILNWRRLNARITLSGQPSEAQLAAIRDLGVTQVINLGPHSNKGALPDEAGTVTGLGMTYTYIPVDFDNPTARDYALFCDALETSTAPAIHIHCIYNARVTAFVYRYACDGKGTSKDAAFALMDGIWRPGGVWAEFIGKPGDVDQPNRYLGYEY